jgi:hypothetical protein
MRGFGRELSPGAGLCSEDDETETKEIRDNAFILHGVQDLDGDKWRLLNNSII